MEGSGLFAPMPIWWLFAFTFGMAADSSRAGKLAVLALASNGYHGGVAGTTRSPVMVAVAATFSLVMVVIVDLDRPGEGWINVTQDAMIDVRNALAELSASTP